MMCAFDFNMTNKAICQVNLQKSVTFAPKASLFEAFFHRDGHGDGSADHGVIAHADQAHHFLGPVEGSVPLHCMPHTWYALHTTCCSVNNDCTHHSRKEQPHYAMF